MMSGSTTEYLIGAGEVIQQSSAFLECVRSREEGGQKTKKRGSVGERWRLTEKGQEKRADICL